VVESGVPPDASSQLFPRVEAQGHSRDRRAEDVADNCHQAVGNQHRPEAGQRKDYRSSDAQHGERQDDRSAFGACLVDCGTDRGLRGEREQAANHGHQSDLGQAPMLSGDQKHVEKRPEGAAHVSEQEVDGVQRQRIETPALGWRHSHNHSVPIVREMMVSGAPTLK